MADVIAALNADRAALLAICANFSGSDWQEPSGCPGWSVQDVVAHMGALYWMVVDPAALRSVAELPTEQAQEALVRHRRSMTAGQVLADYESVSEAALGALAGLIGQDFEIALGDVGTYPAAVVPTAFCFDHYVHIRLDLFPPRGPLRTLPPPSDELRLAPALDWIAAALPQQNAALIASLPGSADLVVTGAASRTITVGTGESLGQISSDSTEFIRWVTQRATWPQADVQVIGDDSRSSPAPEPAHLLTVTRERRIILPCYRYTGSRAGSSDPRPQDWHAWAAASCSPPEAP